MDTTSMTPYIIIAVILLSVPVFLVFSVYRNQRIFCDVKLASLKSTDFLHRQNETFLRFHQELLTQKFQYLDASTLALGQTASEFSLYYHPSLQLWAMLVTMGNPMQNITYIELVQGYDDGSFLTINNANQPSAYPELPIKTMLRFPHINQLTTLLTIQDRARRLLKPHQHIAKGNFHQPLMYVAHFMRQESNMLCQYGYAKTPILADGTRALTLKGAIAMLLRFVPPTKSYFAKRHDQLAAQVMANV